MILNEQLSDIIDAQNELNIKYNGEDWDKKATPVQFYTAVVTEFAEWLESAPRVGELNTEGWKFWRKNLDNDVQNMKVETIDVLHFVISYLLIISDKETILEANEYILKDKVPVEDTYKDLIDTWCRFSANCVYMNANETNKDVLVNTAYMALNVVYLMEQLTSSEYFVADGYFVKNEPNHKRVDGGYQTGEYGKHDENGHEDNRKLVL